MFASRRGLLGLPSGRMAGFERIAPVGSLPLRGTQVRLALKGPAYDQVTPRWNRWAKRDIRTCSSSRSERMNGFTGLDPLQAHIDSHTGWRGIMVEPIPETYARSLRLNVRTPVFDSSKLL